MRIHADPDPQPCLPHFAYLALPDWIVDELGVAAIDPGAPTGQRTGSQERTPGWKLKK